ncbi:MAG: hypothetical protein KY457_15000, partial [Actinobacteria bacterium]|nr:hypothetical protein [Actinomycetota bacterium]
KAPYVDRDGTFYIYGNDQRRGMDVYKVDLGLAPVGAGTATAQATGRDAWLSPVEADRLLAGRTIAAGYEPFCLLGDAR